MTIRDLYLAVKAKKNYKFALGIEFYYPTEEAGGAAPPAPPALSDKP